MYISHVRSFRCDCTSCTRQVLSIVYSSFFLFSMSHLQQRESAYFQGHLGDRYVPADSNSDDLGKGAFGRVISVRHVRDGKDFALKLLLDSNRPNTRDKLKSRTCFDTEIAILSALKHDHIVSFFDNTIDGAGIMLELAPCNSLESRFRSLAGQLNEQDTQALARQILSALAFIHPKGIFHRDIKAENILVFSETPLLVKLADFGLSKHCFKNERVMTAAGTKGSKAPEVHLAKLIHVEGVALHGYDVRADVSLSGSSCTAPSPGGELVTA